MDRTFGTRIRRNDLERGSLACCDVSRHCGIDAEDLVKVDLSEPRELHLPGYVLATDHTTKSVVLSVRGTVSLKDLYTDLLCDSVGAVLVVLR